MLRSGVQFSVPVSGADRIDWAHLDRATLGDPDLAREVLGLFDTHAATVASAIGDHPDNLAMLAHGLKGSARGIGAWQVADAAQRLETALCASADPASALTSLADEISAVRQLIATHLGSRAGAAHDEPL